MIRHQYIIKGQVQGVGFRPFIYQLAIKLDLIGFVRNNNIGIYIEIEGEKKNLIKFEENLKDELPPLAKINFIEKKEIKPLYKGQFEIIQSKLETSTFKIASVPPDIAICKNCLLDINTPLSQNSYYEYFGTNCTNCGPRYSIIQTVPYDRANTSMSKFNMCISCKEEYINPLNRRYHAQPIACKRCGPKLELSTKCKILNSDNIYQQISSLISNGKIGAIKGIGGFHIVCDALNEQVVQKLRILKNRPTKPFAVMCKDINMALNISDITKKEKELFTSKEAPIVLVNKKSNNLNHIAPNINRIGIMLSYTAFYYLLFQHFDNPIIATSANISGEPIITTKDEIEIKLPFVDFIVDYNRDIVNAIDDSVVQVINNDIQILRLARGYAPKEIILPFKIDKKILAFGANQKSTISLAFDNKLVLSPYIADLDNLKSIEYLKRTIKTFKEFYDFEPDVIICDKHSGYESTKLAQQFKIQNPSLEIINIQHHLAHLYSVKAEYNLQGNFTSFIFDGTGLGDDNTLWGGEIFVGNQRKYYFKPLKLLGGEKAIKQCKRIALSLLFEKYSLDEVLKLDLATIRAFKVNEIKLLHNIWQKNLNSPKSSSVGRLFDAIASLSGVCQVQSYEGEAGILTETYINNQKNCDNSAFSYFIYENIIDIDINFFTEQLISKFYNTLVQIIVDISRKEELPIILSGGVFQNKTLLKAIISNCKKENIKYYYNKTIPINDSGISVGQINNYLSNI